MLLVSATLAVLTTLFDLSIRNGNFISASATAATTTVYEIFSSRCEIKPRKFRRSFKNFSKRQADTGLNLRTVRNRSMFCRLARGGTSVMAP
jgi:hypothetical protein